MLVPHTRPLAQAHGTDDNNLGTASVGLGDLRLCAPAASPPKCCFNTSKPTEIITVSTLFRRLKILFFPFLLLTSPGIGNTPTLTSSKRTQNRNTPFTTEARVVRQTDSVFFFFYWWPKCRCMRVPSQVCCGKVALFGWTDRGAVTVSSVSNPQTEAPRPSLPCQNYDGAHSVYHTLRQSATAFLWPWRCATRANSGALEVSTGPLPHETAWVSCGDCSLKIHITRIEEASCLPGGE